MMRTVLLAAAAAVAIALPGSAIAQNSPLAPGEYWEVTGVKIDDGSQLRYANWLASEWRRFNDYAKSQGWISDYSILTNVYNRDDEPDVYIVVKYNSLPDAAEIERRDAAFRAAMQRTDEQMAAASGQRAEYRHVMGSMLLQEMNFRR